MRYYEIHPYEIKGFTKEDRVHYPKRRDRREMRNLLHDLCEAHTYEARRQFMELMDDNSLSPQGEVENCAALQRQVDNEAYFDDMQDFRIEFIGYVAARKVVDEGRGTDEHREMLSFELERDFAQLHEVLYPDSSGQEQ